MEPFDARKYGSVEQYMLARALEQYEQGDPAALLDVAKWALQSHAGVPKEVATAFHRSVNQWTGAETRTLDAAFGVERPKGFRQDDMRRRYNFSRAVYSEVTRLHEKENLPLDGNTFELAGERWGIKKTLAGEMYYALLERIRSRKTSG